MWASVVIFSFEDYSYEEIAQEMFVLADVAVMSLKKEKQSRLIPFQVNF